MLSDVTILDQREDYLFLEGGRQRKGIKTTFRVGPRGPYSVFLADEDFTAAKNLAVVEQKADEVRASTMHPELKA